MRSGAVGQTGNYLRGSCDSKRVDAGRETDSPEQTLDKPIKNSMLRKLVRVGDKLWSTVTFKLCVWDYIIHAHRDAYVNNFILMRVVQYVDE